MSASKAPQHREPPEGGGYFITPPPSRGRMGRGMGWMEHWWARTQTTPSPPRPSATAPGVALPRASLRSSP
ncbi:MAG: hypothetical protein MZU91_01320 [Desulfosudis oleivorans]|nr:hypothetical protein [Desulfosudis oleivorans]